MYKACDIRGKVAEELTPELYRRWGAALGGSLPAGAKFVVGGDVRDSTPAFQEALLDGLCGRGIDAINLGQLPTPMVYHAKNRLKADGCAIVTGSHNPAEINGLKWLLGDDSPGPDDVQRLRELAQRPMADPNGQTRSTPRTLDISFDYVAWLQEMWVDSLRAHCHAILDPMHGCWAARARRYLNAIFPECLLSAIHDCSDARFDGYSPDCSRPERIDELCETVYRQRADLGVAFDGDGDCLALVDNEGMALTAEEAAWVLLQTFGPQLRGDRFVYDLKFSDRIREAAESAGAEAICERSGHTFLRARMRRSGALFGAELTGHYFFRELDGGDDPMMAACRLIAYLAESGRTLSELRRACPTAFITPDLRLAVNGDGGLRVIQQVRQAWSEHPQTTIDGVRVEMPGGWALVRQSVTEQALTFRFESADWHGLEHLVGRFCQLLPELGPQLWTRYKTAMGTHEVPA
jgi:phosphomannomutase